MGAGDSKLQFKSRINQLVETSIAPNDHDFWSVLFTSPLQIDEIFSLISPQDIRNLRRRQPHNLGTVIYKCVEQLYLFSLPTNYMAEHTSAQNSLYLLSRILPFVFEHNNDGFVDLFFFENMIPFLNTEPSQQKPSTPQVAPPAASATTPAPVAPVAMRGSPSGEEKPTEPAEPAEGAQSAEEVAKQPAESVAAEAPSAPAEVAQSAETTQAPESATSVAPEEPAPAAASSSEVPSTAPETAPVQAPSTPVVRPVLKGRKFSSIGDDDLTMPMAEAMITTLVNVLFLPGFTIPTSQLPVTAQDKEREKTLTNGYPEGTKPLFLWNGGICNPEKASVGNDIVQHRIDTLRCLLMCFSQALYSTPESYMKTENRLLTIATTKTPILPTLLYSLLNFVFAYDPAGYLPYTTVLMSDPSERLVEMSLHTLCVLLHHKPKAETGQKNQLAEVLRSINKDEDFSAMAKGFDILLGNIIAANNTYLPNSQKMIPFYEELLVLLWKLLDVNPAFKKYLCVHGEITKLMIPILFIIQTSSKDQAKFPLVQLCSFILLLLSAQREFGVALNKVFDIKTPLDLPVFTGNYADLLIIAIHKLIANDKGVVRPLFDCLLTIICNVSPYCKTLGMVTSIKLLSLFEAFSAPKFLYSAEKNPLFVSLLLETFNNLIQYQYEGNVHLVYSILRKKKIFWDLSKQPNIEEIRELIEKKNQKAKEKNPNQLFFMPTVEWIQSWKKDISLYTILTLLKALSPEVEKLCSQDLATEDDVVQYLKNTTLVGILPVPHTIVIRTFQSNLQIDTFLTTYIWGLIFLKNNRDPPLFDTSAIKLFTVNIV